MSLLSAESISLDSTFNLFIDNKTILFPILLKLFGVVSKTVTSLKSIKNAVFGEVYSR